jgi:hypothetical protein
MEKKNEDEGVNIVGIIVILILLFWAYNQYTSKNISDDYGYDVKTEGIIEQPNCESLYPQNPYDYDTGHSAGFEWGASGKGCGGNSTSFIEGCEEYQNQEEAYE